MIELANFIGRLPFNKSCITGYLNTYLTFKLVPTLKLASKINREIIEESVLKCSTVITVLSN